MKERQKELAECGNRYRIAARKTSEFCNRTPSSDSFTSISAQSPGYNVIS